MPLGNLATKGMRVNPFLVTTKTRLRPSALRKLGYWRNESKPVSGNYKTRLRAGALRKLGCWRDESKPVSGK